MVKQGQIYRHYKGSVYRVIALAKHSETMENMVVYQDVNDESKIWTRPLAMFEEKLVDGKPRFEEIVS